MYCFSPQNSFRPVRSHHGGREEFPLCLVREAEGHSILRDPCCRQQKPTEIYVWGEGLECGLYPKSWKQMHLSSCGNLLWISCYLNEGWRLAFWGRVGQNGKDKAWERVGRIGDSGGITHHSLTPLGILTWLAWIWTSSVVGTVLSRSIGLTGAQQRVRGKDPLPQGDFQQPPKLLDAVQAMQLGCPSAG